MPISRASQAATTMSRSPTRTTTGDWYWTASSPTVQRRWPVDGSNPAIARPCAAPIWTTNTPPATNGDDAKPSSGFLAPSRTGRSTRHSRPPFARSAARRWPAGPRAKTRPPAIVGVERGPSNEPLIPLCLSAMRIRQSSLPEASSKAASTSSPPSENIVTARPPDTATPEYPEPSRARQRTTGAPGPAPNRLPRRALPS